LLLMTSGIRINGVLTYRIQSKKNEKPNRYFKKPIPKTESTLKKTDKKPKTDTDAKYRHRPVTNVNVHHNNNNNNNNNSPIIIVNQIV